MTVGLWFRTHENVHVHVHMHMYMCMSRTHRYEVRSRGSGRFCFCAVHDHNVPFSPNIKVPQNVNLCLHSPLISLCRKVFAFSSLSPACRLCSEPQRPGLLLLCLREAEAFRCFVDERLHTRSAAEPGP